MDKNTLPLWVQLAWPIVVGVAVIAFSKLRTQGTALLESRIKSLEDAGFNIAYRDRLTDRLARIETVLSLVKENQKELLDTMEVSLAEAAHSDDTPDLDYYLDKVKTGLSPQERIEAIRLLDKMIADPATSSGKRGVYSTIRGVMLSKLKSQHRERRLEMLERLR